MPSRKEPTRKKIKRKKGKTRKEDKYFTQETQDNIVAFQDEEDTEVALEIYRKNIQPSFEKLVENLIFVYKFGHLEDIAVLKNDCISFLYESIHKYDVTKGYMAFSYFNVMAKNWFLQKIKEYKKKNSYNINLDQTLLRSLEKENEDMSVESTEDEFMDEEYLHLLKEEIKNWRNKFEKEQEQKILEAVILLFENNHLINVYNKKAVYLYLREITGLNQKQIFSNLKKLKKKYKIFKKRYEQGDI